MIFCGIYYLLFGMEMEMKLEKEKLPKVFRLSPEYFKFVEQREQNEDTPIYLMMNLETRCGYRCVKCALPGVRRDLRKPLSFEERKEILKKGRSVGIECLVIVGAGEPTENFDSLIQPITGAADELEMGSILFTTASHLTEDQARFFRDHNTSLFVSLDSLDPETYRFLTGRGELKKVLENIQLLRGVYREKQEEKGGRKIIRLGINVTVSKQNKDELERIKEFAGDDMQFIANYPIKRGKLGIDAAWEALVGDQYEVLKQRAEEMSETGGHSSIDEGVCSYFNRGISVDTDGELLSCGYASDTAHHLGNISDNMSTEEILQHYKKLRTQYQKFSSAIGRKPSCPLRDSQYQEYLQLLSSQ